MGRRLLYRNSVLGTTKYWHYDETNDRAVIETVQDVGPILERNVKEFNSYSSLDRWKDGVGTKVATIPMTMYAELITSGKINDQKYLSKWLNSPDVRKLRTRPGRI